MINAHRNGLLIKDIFNFWFNVPVGTKYDLLIEGLLQRDDIQLYNLVTKDGCSMPQGLKNLFVSYLESKYVLHKNGYGDKIKTITNLKEIDHDSVVWTFAHVKRSATILKDISCRKFVMLNQFNFHEVNEIKSETSCATDFIMEANIFKPGNLIYDYILPKSFNFHLLPYTVKERFVVKIPITERKPLAIATGTLALVGTEAHKNHYGTNLCHKMRKVIYDNVDFLKGYVDSCITPFQENSKAKKNTTNNFFVRLYTSLYNTFIAKVGSQKSYFSINIVDKYNEYQMAVVPEEYIEVPAIGAFESMACGCAMIGLNHTMYTDFGLVPDEHYISYDGTIEDLKKKVAYYQLHTDELERIATNGRLFVENNFRSNQLQERFAQIILSD